MKLIRTLVGASLCLLIFAGTSSAQTQMLLPYHDPIFQSTWENPAVRPIHRFSGGIPLLSSIEIGAINNGFMLKDVTEWRDGKLYVIGEDLLKEAKRHKINLTYAETELDLLHFRMAWRNHFFWFGLRNVTNQSFHHPRDLVRMVVEGNESFVNQTFDISKTRFDLQSYNEFTFGYSQMYSETLTFGARLSFLTGLFNTHLDTKQITAQITDNEGEMYVHTITADAALYTSCIPRNEKGDPQASAEYLKNHNWVNFKNPGMSVSAGVTYKPEKNTTLTFSFSNLGFIHWGDSLATYKMKEKDFRFDGLSGLNSILYNGIVDWDALDTVYEGHFELDSSGKRNGESYTTMLSPRFHLMATYRLARETLAGLSVSAIVNQGRFYPSVTMSIQQGLGHLFSAQLAMSYNQRSVLNLGCGLIFNPGPIQIYAVTDNLIGLIAPKVMKATNIRFGINLVFGPLSPNTTLTYQ